MKLLGVLLAAAIIFPPCLPDDLRLELQRLYERPPVIAAPPTATLPAATPPLLPAPLPVTQPHFILPTGHAEVSGWYFHDSRFPADGPQHTGLDYACDEGDPIYAAANGTVIGAGWAGDFGNRVVIRHSGGWETRYCHLSRYAAWGWVRQGAVIGYCGDTGLTTGAHLHFEMRLDGMLVDPAGLP